MVGKNLLLLGSWACNNSISWAVGDLIFQSGSVVKQRKSESLHGGRNEADVMEKVTEDSSKHVLIPDCNLSLSPRYFLWVS